MAFGASCRLASLCRVLSADRLPEGHSSWTIWIPVQYEPKAIHGVPLASSTMPASMALKSLCGVERTT